MKTGKYSIIFVIALSVFWAACSNTRRLPANEKLYTGASISISGAPTVAQKKALTEDLEGLARPKPNTRFLGMPIKLSIYNLFRNKKPTSFWGKLRDKYGEPPVLLSQLDLKQNVKLMQNHLENKGYFHAKVSGDTTVRRKKASAKYKADVGDQYVINTVHYPTDSSDLSKAIAATAKNTLLAKDAPFDIEVIKGERARIDAILKEQGFYYFSPEYLLLKTDSTIGNNKVDMYLVVKPGAPEESRQIYHINDVYIYSNYSLNTARLDTLKSYDTVYAGFHIIDKAQKFKPYLFEETMQFRPGEVYNRTAHNRTLKRLINLNLFKFVKNRFEPVGGDSAKLDAYYYLTPLTSKSLRAEVTAITRSNDLNGSQVNFSLLNRNLFRSGAQGNISAYIGSDVQFSGAFKGYNTYRTGAEAAYAIPRFVVPFMNLRKEGPFAPRTTIKVGYDIMNRKDLYTLNSYRLEYGYQWKIDLQRSHEFNPIAITFVQPLNVTDTYKKMQDSIFGLDRAVEEQFILGSRYEYLFNQLASNIQTRNAYYFNGIVDVSGNIAGLISGADAKNGHLVKINNVPFSQYIKVEADARYYRKIGLKSTWASRIDFGYGLPYGNSLQIPYYKQFFVGGNNSLRGFRSRSVGPGTYITPPNPNNVFPDQTGDIKFEVNTEFRPHITGPLYGAMFIDAGNIWLKNDTMYTHKPGSQFTSHFLSQLAVDVGLGVRLDITIFVLRLDVAVPVRKPWVVPPWVVNQFDWNPTWRRQNIVYNLAIGYPF